MPQPRRSATLNKDHTQDHSRTQDPLRPSLPPSRAGKKPVTAYVDKDVHKRLRLLGIELEKSTQQMLSEALEAYLSKHD